MNTETLEAPTVIGTPVSGGIFAGRFFVGAHSYALILSPKDAGELVDVKWGSEKKKVTGALSYSDGRANTEAMAEAGSDLAKRIQALRIGDFDDWYLPSRLESLILFGESRDQFEREWYWTSTQCDWSAGLAWYQDFSNGYRLLLHKYYGLRARAVRRYLIS